MASPRIVAGEPIVCLPSRKEIKAVEEKARYGMSVDTNAARCCRNDSLAVQTESTVTSRLRGILDRLGGCCKVAEAIIGVPEGGKCREQLEPVCRVDGIEMFLGDIEYRVGELSDQIDRLSERLG